ncbi:hypothetical protein [Chromobacterium haemolyticum]|uniref:hypothetical protein n=1 Tax=Chromobacterium haemolyticum TaxID=394935 RepID=UPI0013169A17|nr:hypothetical protein [Chromobacterium haemolyticum]BBH12940.1 hypothetical protein CH06BL_21880 [Chromobacterium haemolyticum]
MVLDTLLTQVLIALCGGLAAELLHWYSLARKPGGVKRFSVYPVYWVTTVSMVALGGLMPVLYIQGTASALLCFHLGAATPVIVQKLIVSGPAIMAHQGAGGATMRDFFGW